MDRSRVSCHYLLLLTVAPAVHGAVRTVTAAGIFSTLFLPDLVYDDGGNDHDQNSGYGNGSEILLDPVEHENHSFEKCRWIT